jgi:hypothetical protein
LNRKGNRLLLAGKHPNKVKVACAREMVCFVWESLNQSGSGVAVAGWNVRSFVDLNASDDLEGKTEYVFGLRRLRPLGAGCSSSFLDGEIPVVWKQLAIGTGS